MRPSRNSVLLRADFGATNALGQTRSQTWTANSDVQEATDAFGVGTGHTNDSLRRLTGATETTAGTATASWAYGYDNAGNRTTHTRAGTTGATAGTTTYSYDAANRLTATSADTTAWTYDGAGNQTVNGITGATSTYNVRGGATGNGPASYLTHGAGNTDTRTRLVGSTTTRYLTSTLGLSGEEVGAALRAFTRTPDGEALANRLGGGSRYYYVTDHQNSIIGMFSATGAWLGGYSYSPYGETRHTATGTATGNNNLRYISGYWDTGAELYKLRARYYDPTTGRFTQYDPSGHDSNPYSYGACDPVAHVDVTGLASAACLSAIAKPSVSFIGFGFATAALVVGASTLVGGVIGTVRFIYSGTALVYNVGTAINTC